MKIGELSRAAGVSASKLRYYESIGLLAPARRRSGRRVYGHEAIGHLDRIAALQYAGFRLADIRSLLHADHARRPASAAWEAVARDRLRELDATLEKLHRVRCDLAAAIHCACEGEAEACGLVTGARAAGSER